MRKIALIFLFIFIGIAHIYSQHIFSIKGIIEDNKTGDPIPYVNVSLKNKYKGTISNEFGEFVYRTKTLEATDILAVSCIGYKSWSMPIQKALDANYLRIRLQPEEYEINEIKIVENKRGLKAKEIVKNAIENIPNNYPQKMYKIKGYYRDYLLGDENYQNLYEASIHIIDPGFQYNDFDSTRFKVLQHRFNKIFKVNKNDLAQYDNNKEKFIPKATVSPLGGNEFSILRIHDPIRNYKVFSFDFFEIFEKDFINNHWLKKKGITYLDGEPIFVIRSRFAANSIMAEGKLFIRLKDWAIIRIEYTIEDDEDDMMSVELEYQDYEGQMYLKYHSFNNLFILSRKDSTFLLEQQHRVGFTTAIDLQPDKTFNQYREFFTTEVNIHPLDTIEFNTFDTTKVIPLYKLDVEKIEDYWKETNYVLRQKLKDNM